MGNGSSFSKCAAAEVRDENVFQSVQEILVMIASAGEWCKASTTGTVRFITSKFYTKVNYVTRLNTRGVAKCLSN